MLDKDKIKLKHLGDGYRGVDPATKVDVVAAAYGDVVAVSAEKAEQMLADFPDEWEVTSEAVTEAAKEVEEFEEDVEEDVEAEQPAPRKGRGKTK